MPQIFSYFANIPQFLFTWGIFFSGGIVFYIWQIYSHRADISIRQLIRHCVPFDPIRSKSFHMDAIIYVMRKFTDKIFMIPGAAILASLAIGTSGVLHDLNGSASLGEISFTGALAGTLFIAFFVEFAYYFFHLIEHRIPFLWELHKVHHSADVLNPLTNQRAHFATFLFKYMVEGSICGIPAGIVMYSLNLSMPEILLMLAVGNKLLLVASMDSLKHSPFPFTFGPLDKLFISPFMHQAHHGSAEAHWDKNFGTNLSIFDWIFGTAYRPQKGEQIDYGIYGYNAEALQEFNTLKGSFIAPLKKCFETMARPFASAQAVR